MTSILDQYEQAILKSKNSILISKNLTTLGYLNTPALDKTPIFTTIRRDVPDLRTSQEQISHVAISNNVIILAVGNSSRLLLFRCYSEESFRIERKGEVVLKKYLSNNVRLSNIFLDPTGCHCLVAAVPILHGDGTPELYYLSKKSNNKLKTASKAKGQEITAVAWQISSTGGDEDTSSTGPILLGTSRGLIIETDLTTDVEKYFNVGFSTGIEHYWRQIFNIGKGVNAPITGLHYHNVDDQYNIFVTTPSRLYYFYCSGISDNPEERPLLQAVFNKYLNIPEKETFIEVDSKLRQSRLQFWSETLSLPDSFIWTTEKCMKFAEIENRTENFSNMVEKIRTIPYPRPENEDLSVSQKRPIANALTQFHVLLAYPEGIRVVCILNGEMLADSNFIPNENMGKVVSVLKDEFTGQYWAVTENGLFTIQALREERNIWQIFCTNQEFERAKKIAKSNDIYYNQVLVKEAEYLFENGQYAQSAERYAETTCNLEEIAMRFIQMDQEDALGTFLKRKLEAFQISVRGDKINADEQTRITMLTIWAIELYLNRLEVMRLNGDQQTPSTEKYRSLQKEFEAVLNLGVVMDCVRQNRRTIYELMASHGDKNNLIKLQIVNRDFEKLIRHHIYKNSYLDALEVLKSQNSADLYYKFASVLMQEVPKQFVKVLTVDHVKLQPSKLLSALVTTCNETLGAHHAKEVIKYLEYAIYQLFNCDKAIHNFLLSLYVKFQSDSVMTYLESQGQEVELVNYDVHFALKLCQEHNLSEACVHLSAILGMWEEAIDLALTFDVDMAEGLVNRSPECDTELRKILWLKIAKHVIAKKNDIQHAIKFLQRCGDVISIEDILPYFPDFVTIDHFRDVICHALRNYNARIHELRDEMEEVTKTADTVRTQIHAVRERCTNVVNANDTCDICDSTLIAHAFYVFPCRHKFHFHCLIQQYNTLMTDSVTLANGDSFISQPQKLMDLERQWRHHSSLASRDTASSGSAMSIRDVVKTELDNLIASECLYCGEYMIETISKPFIEPCDYERIQKEWE